MPFNRASAKVPKDRNRAYVRTNASYLALRGGSWLASTEKDIASAVEVNACVPGFARLTALQKILMRVVGPAISLLPGIKANDIVLIVQD
jgi:hypothetical protein